MKIIATADWHLTKSVPVCRTESEEEWIDYQFRVVEEVFAAARAADAVLCIAGDIFDRSVPSISIINRLLSLRQVYSDVVVVTCAGNHDEPYHNTSLLPSSGYGTLQASKFSVESFPGISVSHFGAEPSSQEVQTVHLCHHLCFPEDETLPPNVEAYSPTEVGQLYPAAEIIICGDYHQSHITTVEDMIVVVPGCLTVQSAALIGYAPRVVLLDTDAIHDPRHIFLSNDINAISREHIDKENTRNARIDAFTNSISTNGGVGVSFEENMESQLKSKTVPQPVKDILLEIKESKK